MFSTVHCWICARDLESLLIRLWCSNTPIGYSECTLLLKADDSNFCKLNGRAPAHAGLFINLNQRKDSSRLPPSADSNQARWPITGSLCKRLKMTVSQYSFASSEGGPQENTACSTEWKPARVTDGLTRYLPDNVLLVCRCVDQKRWCEYSIPIF